MNKLVLILGLSLSITACQPSAKSSHDGHDHGAADTEEAHEEHNNQELTIFTEEAELFAEFHPLVAGQTSNFLAHLTRLNTYRPYTEGTLRVSLIKGETGIRQSVDAPSSPGIFTPSLKPKTSGLHTLIFEVESKFGKERFIATDIMVYASEKVAGKAIAALQKDNQTKFLKEQAWKIDFGTEDVKNANFHNVIKTTGELIASSNSQIRIVAQSSGVIRMQSHDIVGGKTIKKNEPIFHISGQGISDNSITSKYINARSEFDKTKANLQRAEALRKDQIISEREFNEAKSNFEKAEINFQLISKNYSAKGIKVVSPISGYVSNINVSEGEYVEKGQVLAVVVRNSKLILKADLYQKHLNQLPKIRSANFKLPYSKDIFDTNDLGGKMIAYGREINHDDYTTPLYFEINKTPELYTGSFVDVYLKSESSINVLSISKTAVLEDQSIYYVFVQTQGESFEKRFVTIGEDNGREVEILTGLKAGERVVSKGAYFVKLASLAGALPAHGHQH